MTPHQPIYNAITLNRQARADIQWWLQFLPAWNGKAMFLDTTWVLAQNLQFYTDASGSKGYGAYFAGTWLHGDWQPHQRLPQRSIQRQMFAILAAATTWTQWVHGKRICFWCDNQAIVKSWQRKSVKHPQIANLFRRLFLLAANKLPISFDACSYWLHQRPGPVKLGSQHFETHWYTSLTPTNGQTIKSGSVIVRMQSA